MTTSTTSNHNNDQQDSSSMSSFEEISNGWKDDNNAEEQDEEDEEDEYHYEYEEDDEDPNESEDDEDGMEPPPDDNHNNNVAADTHHESGGTESPAVPRVQVIWNPNHQHGIPFYKEEEEDGKPAARSPLAAVAVATTNVPDHPTAWTTRGGGGGGGGGDSSSSVASSSWTSVGGGDPRDLESSSQTSASVASSFVPVQRLNALQLGTEDATGGVSSVASNSWSYPFPGSTDGDGFSITSNGTVVSGFDLLNLNGQVMRRCRFDGYCNPPDATSCRACGAALVANPNVEMDAQIAHHLQHQEQVQADKQVLAQERHRQTWSSQGVFDQARIWQTELHKYLDDNFATRVHFWTTIRTGWAARPRHNQNQNQNHKPYQFMPRVDTVLAMSNFLECAKQRYTPQELVNANTNHPGLAPLMNHHTDATDATPRCLPMFVAYVYTNKGDWPGQNHATIASWLQQQQQQESNTTSSSSNSLLSVLTCPLQAYEYWKQQQGSTWWGAVSLAPIEEEDDDDDTTKNASWATGQAQASPCPALGWMVLVAPGRQHYRQFTVPRKQTETSSSSSSPSSSSPAENHTATTTGSVHDAPSTATRTATSMPPPPSSSSMVLSTNTRNRFHHAHSAQAPVVGGTVPGSVPPQAEEGNNDTTLWSGPLPAAWASNNNNNNNNNNTTANAASATSTTSDDSTPSSHTQQDFTVTTVEGEQAVLPLLCFDGSLRHTGETKRLVRAVEQVCLDFLTSAGIMQPPPPPSSRSRATTTTTSATGFSFAPFSSSTALLPSISQAVSDAVAQSQPQQQQPKPQGHTTTTTTTAFSSPQASSSAPTASSSLRTARAMSPMTATTQSLNQLNLAAHQQQMRTNNNNNPGGSSMPLEEEGNPSPCKKLHVDSGSMDAMASGGNVQNNTTAQTTRVASNAAATRTGHSNDPPITSTTTTSPNVFGNNEDPPYFEVDGWYMQYCPVCDQIIPAFTPCPNGCHLFFQDQPHETTTAVPDTTAGTSTATNNNNGNVVTGPSTDMATDPSPTTGATDTVQSSHSTAPPTEPLTFLPGAPAGLTQMWTATQPTTTTNGADLAATPATTAGQPSLLTLQPGC